jgi:hypothetical protein
MHQEERGVPSQVPGDSLGGEYAARRNWRQASSVGLGTWIGMLLGIAGKLTLVFTMVGDLSDGVRAVRIATITVGG